MSIYLDHNATSSLHPEVLEAMLPFLNNPVGNASSLHSAGRMARSVIETARAQVAALVNSSPDSVIFTSSGSEANNLLIKGYTDPSNPQPLISSLIEHPSVLEPLIQQQSAYSVIHLAPNSHGEIDLKAARLVLKNNQPQLISTLLANNETGVIQPVQALMAMVDSPTCLKHTDATQAIGKLKVDMRKLGVDAISMSAHKFRGPQGVGALVVKRKLKQALISGGVQEKYRRAGTENVAMIVGMGKAAQIAMLEIEHKQHHLILLRDLLESKLASIPGAVIFGARAKRLPNTTYFSIPYYHGETLLMELDRAGFALASGSACHSEVTKASHVLTAMGIEDSLALNAVRVSFGSTNTLQDVESLVAKLRELVNKLPAVIRQAAV